MSEQRPGTQAPSRSDAEPMRELVKSWIGPACKRMSTGGQSNARRAFYHVEPDDLPAVVQGLFAEHGGRLATVSGVDVRDGTELLYHMVFDEMQFVATLKVLLPRERSQMPSITPVLPGAEFIEREIHDLLGVQFVGHPRLERLILADDWPEGVYPLRRDFREKWAEKLNVKQPTGKR